MKKTLKKIAIGTAAVSALLMAVLCVHIYLVTRPKAPDAHSIVMARVDIRQQITQEDADNITGWLYRQKGIDHVLCNPKSSIVVFTFFPVKTTGDEIVARLKENFNLKEATRYIPTEEELKSGCPVASTSVSYKFYNFIRHIF